jgi:hypothetical protein
MRTRQITFFLLLYVFCSDLATAFVGPPCFALSSRTIEVIPSTSLFTLREDEQKASLDLEVASRFKVVICLSQSCSHKRKSLEMDSLATFGVSQMRVFEIEASMPLSCFLCVSTDD